MLNSLIIAAEFRLLKMLIWLGKLALRNPHLPEPNRSGLSESIKRTENLFKELNLE